MRQFHHLTGGFAVEGKLENSPTFAEGASIGSPLEDAIFHDCDTMEGSEGLLSFDGFPHPWMGICTIDKHKYFWQGLFPGDSFSDNIAKTCGRPDIGLTGRDRNNHTICHGDGLAHGPKIGSPDIYKDFTNVLPHDFRGIAVRSVDFKFRFDPFFHTNFVDIAQRGLGIKIETYDVAPLNSEPHSKVEGDRTLAASTFEISYDSNHVSTETQKLPVNEVKLPIIVYVWFMDTALIFLGNPLLVERVYTKQRQHTDLPPPHSSGEAPDTPSFT